MLHLLIGGNVLLTPRTRNATRRIARLSSH